MNNNNSKKIIDATTLTSNMTVNVTDSKTGAIVTFGNKNMSFEQQHKLLSACMNGNATLDLNGLVYTDDGVYKVISIEWPDVNDDTTIDTCDVTYVDDDTTIDTCDVTDVNEIDVIDELDYAYEQEQLNNKIRAATKKRNSEINKKYAALHNLAIATVLGIVTTI